MVDEQFIKEEIYRKIADNESLKIKDEATFKKKLAQLNVAPVVQSFNSVFEKNPNPSLYQFDNSWDEFYDVGQKFLDSLTENGVIENVEFKKGKEFLPDNILDQPKNKYKNDKCPSGYEWVAPHKKYLYHKWVIVKGHCRKRARQ